MNNDKIQLKSVFAFIDERLGNCSEYKGKRGTLNKIQKALSAFDEKNLNKTTAAKIVKNANDVINGL